MNYLQAADISHNFAITGSLSFQQDPNDPQKWIITNDSVGSGSGMSSFGSSGNTAANRKIVTAVAAKQQFNAASRTTAPVKTEMGTMAGGQPSSSGNRQQSSSPDSEMGVGADVKKAGLGGTNGNVKRIACNCPNCVNGVPKRWESQSNFDKINMYFQLYGKRPPTHLPYLRKDLRQNFTSSCPFAWP
jgi:hypothetical protein